MKVRHQSLENELDGAGHRRILGRMPRMQVYLPDALYRAVKKQRLPASELLQNAVRAEIRRRKLVAEGKRHLDELIAEVGEPTPDEQAEADALVASMLRQTRPRARRAG